MVLLEDTRNKVGKHKNIKAYCDRHNIEIVRQCLSVGDYMLPDGNVSVDTKENLEEISRNLMNHNDSSRFWNEIRRSKELGIKLIILVEAGPAYKSINDIARWKSKYSGVTGRSLIEAMIRCEFSYGTIFKFCSKASTAKRILELLEGKE